MEFLCGDKVPLEKQLLLSRCNFDPLKNVSMNLLSGNADSSDCGQEGGLRAGVAS